ncbi:MAG: 3-phosphoshikimate 1-carboxyvinyltransferase [Sphingobacteriales bacterium]|uniref:3-phosphoshikimate 1-carboxyvinyltransferase n=1 Tax=Hydrotalea flava TaxID=714549 RepID=UPI0008345738|nr:3-phosphoshikimate 1-carboxyvinyltransferase [Hydrotalea flava]RTL55071.1 MAG: 3-phosphoshikimate 1-carboxyvinyltransferase [Sphingobacteriales bacterium]
MIATIHPSEIKGTLQAPASKSSMQRACAAALVRTGTSIINNPGYSNDDRAALQVIQQLGATIQNENNRLIIASKGIHANTHQMNCGESGLGIRMFTPLIALNTTAISITGEGSLLQRPMNFFHEILPQLNVKVQTNQGKLPIQVTGPLTPANITIDGTLSSQFLTGLLMAYAAADAKDVSISVNNLKSKPYIDLTLKVMEHFGLKTPKNNGYTSFYFDKAWHATSQNNIVEYEVEGDWSGAAFLLVAGAIAGNITVKGLDIHSTQADKAILQALIDTGCLISIEPNQIHIQKSNLQAFHFNATDCPDLFPPLVALAAYCKGTTVIEGTERLTHKESNRALTLQEEFWKMGVHIQLQGNLMLIEGGNDLLASTVSSWHDHRIAMACALAALKATGPVVIQSAEAINKSYPDFYHHISALGAVVSLHH